MTDSKPWFDLDLFVNLRTDDEDLFSVGNFILLILNVCSLWCAVIMILIECFVSSFELVVMSGFI